VVSPDVGGIQDGLRLLSQFLDADWPIVAKRRKSASDSGIRWASSASSEGRKRRYGCDYLTRRPGTLSQGRALMHTSGAKQVFACVSHAFSTTRHRTPAKIDY
jgi:phosphoribosylpyrophosphate synthetase